MGGEKPVKIILWHSCQGSPPHRRGKEQGAGGRMAAHGITPAWAGKRMRCRLGYGQSRDHPRAGGEKAPVLSLIRGMLGSPPHRRGKVGLDGGLSEAVGITPAQAGKSKLALCTPSCPTDHPCAGGEKNKELEGVWLPMGSPPRGRGKVLYRVPEVVPVRITPA